MTALQMKYFVLKPEGNNAYALASRSAMFAYALAITEANPELAKGLECWAEKEYRKANKP